MYETQYVLLFGVGSLLTIGAWTTDRGRGFAATAGIFVWAVLGFGSTALVIRAAGQEYVYASSALAWLCFGNVAMHAVATVLHIHSVWSGADDDAAMLDPDQQLDRDWLTQE